MGDLGYGRHKLHQLLTNFVTPEIVPDVECEGCNKNHEATAVSSKQIKILNFGKVHPPFLTLHLYLLVSLFQLPVCLCIHISRNTWLSSGMSKRQDFVQFPMRLSLAAYTFLQAQYQRKINTPVSM